jgi:hypothetical protein
MSASVGTRVQSVGDDVPEIDVFPGVCFSACTLAFLGGHFRFIDKESKFGVHRFYFQNPSPNNADIAQVLSASLASYVHEMGIDVRFMELSARKGGSEIEVVPHGVLKELNVVNDGTTIEQWSVEGLEGALYVRGDRDTI